MQAGAQAGVFQATGAAGLTAYDERPGSAWDRQAAEGAMTTAPFGGVIAANPADRGTRGPKRRLQTDETGIPLAVLVDGANRHTRKRIGATRDRIVSGRPNPTDRALPQRCLDTGYDDPVERTDVTGRGEIRHRYRSKPGVGCGPD